MAVDEQLIADWCTELCVDRDFPLHLPFKLGPDVPEWANADRIGAITVLPGTGLTHDGLFDLMSFQVRGRSKTSQRSKLRETMHELDRVLVREVANQELWGGYVRLVGRTGGGPSPLQEDQRERISFVCTYFAHVEL